MIQVPQMLMIGSSGRNSGKTTLATQLIKDHPDISFIGLKVVTILKKDGKCPRGGSGCGICTSIKGDYELTQEHNTGTDKDTSLLLKAGAEKVYFLRVLKSHLEEGIESFLKIAPKDTYILCESNSLRKIVEPGGFVFLDNGNGSMKPTAKEISHLPDMVITGDAKSASKRISFHKEICKIALDTKSNEIRS